MNQFRLISLMLLVSSYLTESAGQESHEKQEKDLMIVSTIDGKISVLRSSDGDLIWSLSTEPAGLFSSSLAQLQVLSHGKQVQLIPSLEGELFEFDGKTLHTLPFSAETILSTSYRVGDNLNVVGGKDIKIYGIDLLTGKLRYTCSSEGCEQYSAVSEAEDILVVERHSLTVRAVSSRTGDEQWSYKIGKHQITLSKGMKMDLRSTNQFVNDPNPGKHFHSNQKFYKDNIKDLSISMTQGLITLDQSKTDQKWSRKLSSPIVDMWRLHRDNIEGVDLFQKPGFLRKNELQSLLLVGIYDNKLYIKQRSKELSKTYLEPRFKSHIEPVFDSFWMPVFPEDLPQLPFESKQAALTSVDPDHNRENGIFFYEINSSISNSSQCFETNKSATATFYSIIHGWKVFVIACISSLLCSVACYFALKHYSDLIMVNEKRLLKVIQDKEVSLPITEKTISNKSQIMLKSNDVPLFSCYQSRFMNDFEPIECLGRGGYGVVFEAKNKIDCCSYAVKKIEFTKSHAFDRALREVKVLAKLDHRGIVRYYNAWVETSPVGYLDACIKEYVDMSLSTFSETSATSEMPKLKLINPLKPFDDMLLPHSSDVLFQRDSNDSSHISSQHIDKPSSSDVIIEEMEATNVNKVDKKPVGSVRYLFIQMQLCRKESLREWLSSHQGQRDHFEILDIFYQIVVAVEYVHAKGLMHRDLKPSNIFFSLDGDVKIGDFGLVSSANEVQPPHAENSKSKTFLKHTDGVGTELYKSPEVIHGSDYNNKIDIFALGLIFYELLVPFSTEFERVMVLTKIKSGEFPEEFRAKFDYECEFAATLLEKNPDKRPSASQIKMHPLFLSIRKLRKHHPKRKNEE